MESIIDVVLGIDDGDSEIRRGVLGDMEDRNLVIEEVRGCEEHRVFCKTGNRIDELGVRVPWDVPFIFEFQSCDLREHVDLDDRYCVSVRAENHVGIFRVRVDRRWVVNRLVLVGCVRGFVGGNVDESFVDWLDFR